MTRRAAAGDGAALAGAVALVVLLAGCRAPTLRQLPAPSSVRQPTTTQAAQDTSGVDLAAAPGRSTTTAPAVAGGGATLRGVVSGADGRPVAGATVHLERMVGDGVGRLDVLTGADGRWRAAPVLGGRYRVRAWRAPDADLVTPVLFFLGVTEDRAVPLTLGRYGGVTVTSAMNPSPPVVGRGANLAIQVASRSVDADGVVRTVPLRVAATLAPPPSLAVFPATPVPTDAAGRAVWLVQCLSPGPIPATVLIKTQPYPLTLPPCTAAPTPPPPQTTTTAPPTTAPPTTTVPPPPPSSTTITPKP